MPVKVYLRERLRRMRSRRDPGPGTQDPGPGLGVFSSTYSRYFAQLAGSDMAMKQQLVRMVHMMKRLNKVL